MQKRYIRDGIIVVASIIVVVVVAVFYSVFASRHIFNESKEHLSEIYLQANTTFMQNIESRRKLLHSLEQYIENSVADLNSEDAAIRDGRRNETEAFMTKQIEQWGFTDFYFMNSDVKSRKKDLAEVESLNDDEYINGVDCKALGHWDSENNIYDIDDELDIVHLRFRRNISDLLEKDSAGVVGHEFIDGEEKEFMMFAIKVKKPQIFEGFEYDSIGIRFSSEDMINLLSVKTFGQMGACYILLPDGNILIQSRVQSLEYTNYLDFLSAPTCDLEASEIENIKKDWDQKKTGTCLMKYNGIEYYMTYMPVGYADWMFVGAVPSETVNSSLDWFRTVTIIVMVVICMFVVAVVIVMLVMNNIRMVKESKLQVKSREQLLNLLSQNTTDIFITFSPETFECEFVSDNIKQVLGIEYEEIKKDVRKILKAAIDYDKTFSSASLKALPEGNAWESDSRMQHVETNKIYWFHTALYHSKENKKDRCVLVLFDRTEERNMRANLEQALELAKNANAAKSNFLSNMSHDIRTPMNAIIGYATLLAKDAENPERVRDYTHKITYSGQHLLSLINDVLDMSKIESGKTSLYIEQFSLTEFIESLYSMMISQTNAKKQTFDVHTKGRIPEFVLGDKMRLNQILLNILSNAVKYTPAGGTISLRVETMKQQVHNHVHIMFTVADNGIGMSEDYVKTIFEPFSRETTAETKGIQGTGLGMAITKNIVDLMGGVLSVESELGKGSTFTVELELALGKDVPDDEDFWKHHNVTHVLVVDDEEDICMDIKKLMSDTGVDVDYALTGSKAVEMVEQSVKNKQDYNIVLLDWKMPEMDGVETARKIRAKVGRDIPIMVLTSYSFEDIEEEARAAGIDLFLSKPFFVSNFRRAIMQINSDGVAADITPEDDDISIDGLRVLAAEDNEINVEILMELLEIEGVKCDVACNGEEAVEKFVNSAPGSYDIVFMDIQMPVMNGYDATRAIRASNHGDAKNIPIIAMTANAFDDDVKAAIQSGMNAHLAKPIDMKKLKQLVSKLVQRREPDKNGSASDKIEERAKEVAASKNASGKKPASKTSAVKKTAGKSAAGKKPASKNAKSKTDKSKEDKQ